MNETILITAALLYANGPLHLGHMAGAYLPADCYARFKRFLGDEVLFLSGSDEYGAAITLAAERLKRSPKEHVDDFHTQALKSFKQFNCSFDHYSRTTWPGHHQTVIEFYKDLKDQNLIEQRITQQLYSEEDARFLADRYVIGICPKCNFQEARGDECPKCGASYEASDLLQPRSKLTGAPLILKDTEHSFLLLDKLKDQLRHWISKKAWKPQVLNMALQYIEDLHARCISRDLKWGISVPDKKDKVFYVWFDAPIGYISAAKEWSEQKNQPEAWKHFWLNSKTKYVQFIGKDNIPFHSVFFPAMVMGQKKDYKQVDELPANAFFHYEGKKFSKSEGWFIDLEDFFKKFSSDQIRYYLAANAPETSDSEFSWKDFQLKNNTELVGKLGNFINRTLVFLFQKSDPKMVMIKHSSEQDQNYFNEINNLSEKIKQAYESFHLRKVTQLLMELATAGNVYFDEMQPWKKNKEDPLKVKNILGHCLCGIKALAICSYPIIPTAAQKIWSLLGFKDQLIDHSFMQRLIQPLPIGQSIVKPEILFKKIEDDAINKELAKLHK